MPCSYVFCSLEQAGCFLRGGKHSVYCREHWGIVTEAAAGCGNSQHYHSNPGKKSI